MGSRLTAKVLDRKFNRLGCIGDVSSVLSKTINKSNSFSERCKTSGCFSGTDTHLPSKNGIVLNLCIQGQY
jgi:hypothetical protein